MPSSPAIDPTTVPASVGSSYPPEFAAGSAQRQKRRLGDVFGLTAFGVNMTTLPPGTESALRHYHTEQDEFVYIVAGKLVLVTDDGEQELTAGMVAGFKRGEAAWPPSGQSRRERRRLSRGRRPQPGRCDVLPRPRFDHRTERA